MRDSSSYCIPSLSPSKKYPIISPTIKIAAVKITYLTNNPITKPIPSPHHSIIPQPVPTIKHPSPTGILFLPQTGRNNIFYSVVIPALFYSFPISCSMTMPDWNCICILSAEITLMLATSRLTRSLSNSGIWPLFPFRKASMSFTRCS